MDRDFGVPAAAVRVAIVETRQETQTAEQGNYTFAAVPPGRYTVIFAKDGYLRQVKADVVVQAGQLTDLNVDLRGEFIEMQEFVVQDLVLDAGSETALLQLRLDSPALLDSISADLMSRAGAGDAAAALRLVAGASTQDGKSAVIRGLPDRYVSAQLNGVRLPTADEDKRAVELDQFPAGVIESIQVTKTFTPDQQGDASGGAVDVRLKGIPDQWFFQVKGQYGYNTQVRGRGDFLSYEGGGVSALGHDDGRRDIQFDNLGRNWDGAAGVTPVGAPTDFKSSIAFGGVHELDSGVKLGGQVHLFYERDSSFFDDGRDDSWWVEGPGADMTPQIDGDRPPEGGGNFTTALFDVTQAAESVQWGGLANFGVELENHRFGLTYLHTRTTEDTATLAEDTRGKQYFYPEYDPDDPSTPGHSFDDLFAAPYLRLETLEYTERSLGSLQLRGRHTLPVDGFGSEGLIEFGAPELDWVVADSFADEYQPDKRLFGSQWFATEDGRFIYLGLPPDTNVNLGNLQRVWKTVEEDSRQWAGNLTLPFEPWNGELGYLKAGLFRDHVDRRFDQDSFSNFGDSSASFQGGWDEFWSEHWDEEDHPITASSFDVDYTGALDVSAWYWMADLPLFGSLDLIGGFRFESTEIDVVNFPEKDALWYPPGDSAPRQLRPGDADVFFRQSDALPSIGLAFEPSAKLTLRGSYGQTVARQTFKELTPILQQEFLGGPVFIGNPQLRMSQLENYDVRADYTPYAGGLVSASWFRKNLSDPIEYVQRVGDFTFTTPANYPSGVLMGYELELRQSLGHFAEGLAGLGVGANATFLKSEVRLPADEAQRFADIGFPISSRDMTDAPQRLLNFFLTYDLEASGTRLALFYTLQGDALVAGAGESDGNFVPSVYAREYETVNFSVSQSFWSYFQLQFQAKNLTNPRIEEVYRSGFIDGDVLRSSFTRGREYSLGLAFEVTF